MRQRNAVCPETAVCKDRHNTWRDLSTTVEVVIFPRAVLRLLCYDRDRLVFRTKVSANRPHDLAIRSSQQLAAKRIGRTIAGALFDCDDGIDLTPRTALVEP